MKKIFAVFCLAGCLAMAVPSLAVVRTFGPDFSRFSLDVPDGWKAVPKNGGCQLISPDGNSSFSVHVQRSGGKSLAELTKDIKRRMGGRILSEQNIDSDKSVIEAEVDGIRIKLFIMVEGDQFCAVTMAGSDEAGMLRIMDTLNNAK